MILLLIYNLIIQVTTPPAIHDVPGFLLKIFPSSTWHDNYSDKCLDMAKPSLFSTVSM